MLYVKWDSETGTISAGPQEINPSNTEGWTVFLPYPDNSRLLEGEYYVYDYFAQENIVTERKVGTPVNQYIESRKRAYPGMDEQLDLLWHDIHNGTLNTSGQFYQALLQVKEDYPK